MRSNIKENYDWFMIYTLIRLEQLHKFSVHVSLWCYPREDACFTQVILSCLIIIAAGPYYYYNFYIQSSLYYSLKVRLSSLIVLLITFWWIKSVWGWGGGAEEVEANMEFMVRNLDNLGYSLKVGCFLRKLSSPGEILSYQSTAYYCCGLYCFDLNE